MAKPFCVGPMGTRGGGWTPRPFQGPELGSDDAFVVVEVVDGGRRSSDVEDGPPMKTGASAMYLSSSL